MLGVVETWRGLIGVRNTAPLPPTTLNSCSSSSCLRDLSRDVCDLGVEGCVAVQVKSAHERIQAQALQENIIKKVTPAPLPPTLRKTAISRLRTQRPSAWRRRRCRAPSSTPAPHASVRATRHPASLPSSLTRGILRLREPWVPCAPANTHPMHPSSPDPSAEAGDGLQRGGCGSRRNAAPRSAWRPRPRSVRKQRRSRMRRRRRPRRRRTAWPGRHCRPPSRPDARS